MKRLHAEWRVIVARFRLCVGEFRTQRLAVERAFWQERVKLLKRKLLESRAPWN